MVARTTPSAMGNASFQHVIFVFFSKKMWGKYLQVPHWEVLALLVFWVM